MEKSKKDPPIKQMDQTIKAVLDRALVLLEDQLTQTSLTDDSINQMGRSFDTLIRVYQRLLGYDQHLMRLSENKNQLTVEAMGNQILARLARYRRLILTPDTPDTQGETL
jgi:hypothetical protein